MKVLTNIIIAFALVFAASFDADATEEIVGQISAGDTYLFTDNDILITANGSLEAPNIQINNNIYIHNLGAIHGGINILENKTLRLQNSGVFDASVVFETGARLVQVITSNSEITNIGLTSGFDVFISGDTEIDLDQLTQITSVANSVEISGARLSGSSINDFAGMQNVKLLGDILLTFDDLPNMPTVLFSNVSGNGNVAIDPRSADNLYLVETYVVNNKMFVHKLRSTDYQRILNNNMGMFLNDLRNSREDDKLFKKLDIAATKSDIDTILHSSVRTNPILMMRPIKIMYSQKMLDIMPTSDKPTFGAQPFLIYSSDMRLGGVRPNITFNLSDDLHFDVSGYVLNIDYSDDINTYGGTSFELDFRAQYNINHNNFVRVRAAAGKSYFDVGHVFDGNVAVNNPGGSSLYFDGEFGHNFNIGSKYKLSPFVAAMTEYFDVLNTEDQNEYLIVGSDFGYDYNNDGLQYGVKLRSIGRNDKTFGIGINMSLWSLIDEAGADLYLGTIYNDELGTSYRASFNGRFCF